MADGNIMFCAFWLKSERQWVDGSRDRNGELITWDATHWMPLPFPPEAK